MNQHFALEFQAFQFIRSMFLLHVVTEYVTGQSTFSHAEARTPTRTSSSELMGHGFCSRMLRNLHAYESHIGILSVQIQSHMRRDSIPPPQKKSQIYLHNAHHTCSGPHTPMFTSCLHHAQLGCERIHFWQEGTGWQDPCRDRSGSSHSAASPEDVILVSNSL